MHDEHQSYWSHSPFNITPGVVTHSSGNHGAALALAAHKRGIPAYIVMPSNSSNVKFQAVESYRGIIEHCEPNLQAREATCAQVIQRTGATMVHPFNDYRIIAGQSTATIELLAQANKLDIILCPVGGGGLLSGTALAAHFFGGGQQNGTPTRVIGVEPEKVDDAARSFKSGSIEPVKDPNSTIADGLRTTLGDKTLPIIRHYVADIVTVSEEAIVNAMLLLWERMKIVVEVCNVI